MRQVMFTKKNSILRHADFLQNVTLNPQFFVEPGNHCLAEDARSSGKGAQYRHQNAFELYQWLFMKHDIVEVFTPEAALGQTELDGQLRKSMVVLFAAEALFFRGSD